MYINKFNVVVDMEHIGSHCFTNMENGRNVSQKVFYVKVHKQIQSKRNAFLSDKLNKVV